MCKIVRCRNCLILLLFLLICHHHHCASCCCCHVSLPWWHGTRLMWRWGCQADGLEDNGEALPQLIGEISPLSGVLPYVFLHRAQPTSCHKNRCDGSRHGAPILTPPYTTVTQHLADCCMWRHWVWGTMAAVRLRLPPWLERGCMV